MSYSTSVFVYVQRQIVIVNTDNSRRIYSPVYSKPLTLHKGVDNRLTFHFLNAEQKPVDITGKSITCRLLNDTGNTILLEKALDLNLPLTGIASLNLVAADLENIDAQNAFYTLEIPYGNNDYPVFVNQNASARGDLNIVNSILPSFVPSSNITIPTGQAFPNLPNATGTYTYISSVINTEDNPILTIQTKFEGFYGNVLVEGSTQPDTEWYPIEFENDLEDVSENRGYTVVGFHPYIRMSFTSNAGAVTNILAR